MWKETCAESACLVIVVVAEVGQQAGRPITGQLRMRIISSTRRVIDVIESYFRRTCTALLKNKHRLLNIGRICCVSLEMHRPRTRFERRVHASTFC